MYHENKLILNSVNHGISCWMHIVHWRKLNWNGWIGLSILNLVVLRKFCLFRLNNTFITCPYDIQLQLYLRRIECIARNKLKSKLKICLYRSPKVQCLWWHESIISEQFGYLLFFLVMIYSISFISSFFIHCIHDQVHVNLFVSHAKCNQQFKKKNTI